VEEIIPQAYVHMGTPFFQQPQNPGWSQKVSYKVKAEAVREKRKENPRLKQREVTDYRFYTFFQQDVYESVILPKNKPVAISQLVDWEYMEHKNYTFFNQVVVAFKAKNLRDVMAFQKYWNNEIITQFYATLYVKEHGDTRKLHWMTKGQWFEVTYA
jgi:hypothetical protein